MTPSLLTAALWVAIYLLLVLAPVLVMLLGQTAGAGFWWDFAMAIGFSAMAIMGVQFALTARFRRATAPFGIDIIYYFHRFAAVLALLMVCGHALVVLVDTPGALLPRNPLSAPWHMTAGRLALLCFIVVVATSLWRKQLRIEYDHWRIGHTLLATVGFLLAVGHIEGASYSIEAPATRLLWTTYTAFWVLLVVHIRLVRPWLLSRAPYQVVDVRQETRDVWTLAVEPRRGAGIRFRPGQFVWLTARASPFRLKEHPFSISSHPGECPRIELTIKELGDFSSTIKDFRAGETVYVDGPYGVFTHERYPEAPGFVFIAGGIGIAPIMSMLRTLALEGDRRPLTLIYGNWTADRVVFHDEIDELRSRLNLDVLHVLQEPPADWNGESGVISREILERSLPAVRDGFEYFLCGPNPMLRSVEQSLSHLHVPYRKVHSEIFDMV